MSRTPLYTALIRPATWRGLPILQWAMLFFGAAFMLQLTKSPLYVLCTAVVIFAFLRYAAWRDPYWIENWLLRLRKTPPVMNAVHWGGNSYEPR